MSKKVRNFKEQTRVLFLKYTLIPIIFLFIVFGIGLFSFSAWKVSHDAEKVGETTVADISKVLRNYETGFDELAKNQAVINYLKYKQHSNKVFAAFYAFNSQQQVQSVFQLVDPQGQGLSSAMLEDSTSLDISSYRLKRWSRSDQLIIEAETKNLAHNKKTVLLLSQAVKDQGEIIGYLVVRLKDEDFQRMFFGNKADVLVVTDKYDRVIVSNSNSVEGLMGKFTYEREHGQRVQLGKKAYYMNEQVAMAYPLRVYSLIASPNYQELFIFYVLFTTISSGVLFILLHYLSRRMSVQHSMALNTMMNALDHLKSGELNNYVEIPTGDEFEKLAHRYNEMLKSLDLLLLRNQELTYILQRDEIRFLQSQFNPHFLFNMLETIRYTMRVDEEKAQRIILTLSRILRYSINQGEQHATLKKDMDYIADYLKLHAYRYNDRLHYKVNLPDDLHDIEIPKLLLQPLVENAIKYGYEKQLQLMITITVEQVGEELHLLVVDNGHGIAPEKLREITETLHEPLNNGDRIGVYNTHRKIVLLHGENYGLTIQSQLGEGTSVRLVLPIAKGEKHV